MLLFYIPQTYNLNNYSYIAKAYLLHITSEPEHKCR
jgi:hypothetical protein